MLRRSRDSIHGTPSEKRRQKRAATARPERLWDYGVIPYEIDANFSGKDLFDKFCLEKSLELIILPILSHPERTFIFYFRIS